MDTKPNDSATPSACCRPCCFATSARRVGAAARADHGALGYRGVLLSQSFQKSLIQEYAATSIGSLIIFQGISLKDFWKPCFPLRTSCAFGLLVEIQELVCFELPRASKRP